MSSECNIGESERVKVENFYSGVVKSQTFWGSFFLFQVWVPFSFFKCGFLFPLSMNSSVQCSVSVSRKDPVQRIVNGSVLIE